MIKPFDYLRLLPEIETEIHEAFARVLHSGWLLLGPETEALERELAEWIGARHCVAVHSGTTALHLALRALDVGPGDRVVTVANTCSPTAAAIRLAGADPVFVEVLDDGLMMDVDAAAKALDEGAECVIPVHLWGDAVEIERLVELAGERGVPVIEDCAQAQGTRFRGRRVGTFGHMGCFSFYPTKNLGAFGDGGAVVTDDDELADRLRALRMYGYRGSQVSEMEGANGRMNEVQAAILRVKLRVLDDWLARRRRVAERYHQGLDRSSVRPPRRVEHIEPSYHQFVVRTRDRDGLVAALDEAGIGYGIHYPVPLHHMPAYRRFASAPLPVTERAADEILSLPIHEALTEDEVDWVIEVAGRFRSEGSP
jgi:aminotransferase EvaB